MSNQLIEGLFLLAFWAPPLTVLAGVLSQLTADGSAIRSTMRSHAAPLTH